jgi:hypothetical protein
MHNQTKMKSNMYFQNSLKAAAAFLFVMIISAGCTACSGNEDNPSEPTNVSAIADAVWEFSQTHPDGFTLDIRTMTEATEGISVSYAVTQNSHSCDQLDFVVEQALQHDGYVGGWLNPENGLYYFDSSKLFPEDQLEEALQFGKENGQTSVYILSTGTEVYINYD